MTESKVEYERRYLTNQVRSQSKDGETEIWGYAAVFDSLSENLGGFFEIVSYGAFYGSLTRDIVGTFNHNPNFVLGRTKSGTLNLQEDANGLLFRVWPPEASWARDLLVSLKRGDVTGASFAFKTLEDDWTVEGGRTIRRLIEVELFDVSVVTFPAYPAAGAKVRHLQPGSEAGRVLVSNQARRRALEILEKGKP